MNEKYFLQDGIFFPRERNTKDFTYSDGAEFENQIYQAILAAKDRSLFSPELIKHIVDWPSLCHLSPVRANLFRPLEELFNGKTLELGAGCGILTRYLGECGGDVTALEASVLRSKIIRARNQDLPNVSVVCDRIEDFSSDKKFNVITMIGVLQYARQFSLYKNNAEKELLKSAIKHLDDNGTLVIAIQNKLGLKYFAGIPEANTGIPFFGIENRYSSDSIIRFDRSEIMLMLESLGFKFLEILYPFPDYHMPVSIFNEKAMQESDSFSAVDLIMSSAYRDKIRPDWVEPNFMLESAWETVYKAGLAKDLSNAFLIVARKSKNDVKRKNDVLGWHFSANRPAAYATQKQFVAYTDGVMVNACRINEIVVGCSLCLMSDFVGNSNGMPIGGKMFLEKIRNRLKYIVQGPNNERIEDYLDIDVPELTTEVLKNLKNRILEETSKRGHVPPLVCDSQLSHVMHSKPYIPGRILWVSFIDSIKKSTCIFEEISEICLTWIKFICEQESINFDKMNLRTQYISGRFFDCTPFNCVKNHRGIFFFDEEWILHDRILLLDLLIIGLSACFENITKINISYDIFIRKILENMGVTFFQSDIQNAQEFCSYIQRKIHAHDVPYQKNLQQDLRQDMKQKFNFVQRIKLNTRKFFSLKNINSVSMNVSPLVSVIIPVYNREKFINASIESVLNQTYKNIELIVIDDGSSDNTINILNGINDSRLRIYSQPNRGRSVARNFALNLAKGKYIAFLDSDDIYLPQKIQLQVDFLEKNKKYSVMYTSATCVGENGESLNFEYRASKSGWIYNDIAYFLPITVILPTVMFEKTVYLKVGGFDEFLHRFEDVDLWRKISKYYEFYAMNVVTCEIRTHNDNVIYNQNPETIIQNLERYVDKILNEDRKIYRANGLKKLYDYYIDAFLSVPRFYNFASQLKKLKKVRFP